MTTHREPEGARIAPWNADELFEAIESMRRKRRASNRGTTLSFAESIRLERAIVALAKLAAPDPQFNNPIEAWSAQSLRDRILESARGAGTLRGES